jgi:hypothetical protein
VRATPVILVACLAFAEARAQSVNDTLRGLDECFALFRMADRICENPDNVAAVRFDCLKKARDAHKECLDHVRGSLDKGAPPTGASSEPDRRKPPEREATNPANEPLDKSGSRTTIRQPQAPAAAAVQPQNPPQAAGGTDAGAQSPGAQGSGPQSPGPAAARPLAPADTASPPERRRPPEREATNPPNEGPGKTSDRPLTRQPPGPAAPSIQSPSPHAVGSQSPGGTQPGAEAPSVKGSGTPSPEPNTQRPPAPATTASEPERPKPPEHKAANTPDERLNGSADRTSPQSPATPSVPLPSPRPQDSQSPVRTESGTRAPAVQSSQTPKPAAPHRITPRTNAASEPDRQKPPEREPAPPRNEQVEKSSDRTTARQPQGPSAPTVQAPNPLALGSQAVAGTEPHAPAPSVQRSDIQSPGPAAPDTPVSELPAQTAIPWLSAPMTGASPTAASPRAPESAPEPRREALGSPNAMPPPASSSKATDSPVDANEPARNTPSVASSWLVSETVSPIDYSPLVLAELHALTPVSNGAPSTLALRCRGSRTEISFRAQGTWRPLRTGGVEVAMLPAGESAAQRFHWPLSPDGRSTSSPQDVRDTVLTFRAGRIAVAVADGVGGGGTAYFDLAGIEAVRARLGAACRWPKMLESRGR